ncbi:MAG: hypothetical protein COC12_07130 [Rhodobacteraceae bacterium]|nr:MAG: hypothetical protein COC12_07130 [Paracoccaceae bacterium]
MTDYARLLNQLTTDTLDAATFRHVDHLGVAYQALANSGFFDALHTVATGIDRAATRAGALDKFNATITVAFMCLIAERMVANPYDNAQDFIDRNPDLVTGAPLRALYSPERMTSARARRIALLPDLPQDGSRQRLTIG